MRVGCIDYINSTPLVAPFRTAVLKPPGELTYAIPSRLNALLRAGELDVSFISAAELFSGNYTHIPSLGIYAKEAILSVNLYVKETLPSLDGVTIGLTHHSATSRLLLKVLCTHFWHATPHFEPLGQGRYDAFLLIGDEALEKQTIPGYETLDLATEWHKATGLPFVFAVLAARPKVDPAPVEQAFLEALTWSEAHWEEVSKVSPTYLNLCHYRLGPREHEALARFQQLAHDVHEREARHHPTPL